MSTTDSIDLDILGDALTVDPIRQSAVQPVQTNGQKDDLEVCLRDFGFAAMTADEFLQVGIDELNASMVKACRAGAAFWAAQEALKNTESAAGGLVDFKAWIEDRGLTKQRVYECISLARFYSRLPATHRNKLLTAGKKQALLLASMPQDVIDEATSSGRDLLDDANLMTVAELRAEVASMKKRAANAEAEIERRDSLIKRLQSRGRASPFTPATEDLRAECLVHQAAGELAVGSLLNMYDAAAGQLDGMPERDLQIDQVWITLHAIAARALDAIRRIREEDLQPLPERVMSQNLLTDEEAERWVLEWRTLERRHDAEKAVRQAARDEARPRGPGRPKKVQG